MKLRSCCVLVVAACSSSPGPKPRPTPDPVQPAPGDPIDVGAFRGRCQSSKHGVDKTCEPPFDFAVNIDTVASCYWSRSGGQFRLDTRGAMSGEQIAFVVDGFAPDPANPTRTLTIDPASEPPGHLKLSEVLPQNGCKQAGTDVIQYPAASSPCNAPCTITLTDSDPRATGARPFDIEISCPQLCVDNTAYVCTSLAGGALQWKTRQTCEPSS